MEYILITGASTGIGYATAQHLIQNGYFVFGSVRKQEDAQKLETDFKVNFKALIFDVADSEAIHNAKVEVEKIIGDNNLKGLINNAGIVAHGPLQHIPMEEFKYQFEVNVFGILRVTQAFLPLLGASQERKSKPGKIINISSVSGIFTTPFIVPYCASKASVESLTDGLRRELLMFGIDAISIRPGPIKTPIWKKAISTNNRYSETDYGAIYEKTNKLISKTEANAIPPIKVAKLGYT